MPLTFGSLGGDDEVSLPPPAGTKEEDVKPGDPPTGKRRGRPPGTPNRAKTEDLQRRIEEKLMETVAAPIGFVSPLTAANMQHRSHKFSVALTRLAIKNASIRKGLETFLDGSDMAELVLFPLTCAMAFAIDFDKLSKDAMAPKTFGLDELYDELYADENNPPDANGNGDWVSTDVAPRGLLGRLQ